MPCPRCGQDAPLVYRDYTATCSACGALRVPLAAPGVATAGKPSQVSGTVAKVLGWMMLASGALLSALLFALFSAMWPGSAAPWIVALVTLLITSVFTAIFVLGGKSLVSSGQRKQEEVRKRAIEGMARQRGGIVTARDVAAQLRMPVSEVDAWLTDLAKREPETLALDLDDEGTLSFRYLALAPMPRVDFRDAGAPPPGTAEPRTRVAPAPAADVVPLEAEDDLRSPDRARSHRG